MLTKVGKTDSKNKSQFFLAKWPIFGHKLKNIKNKENNNMEMQTRQHEEIFEDFAMRHPEWAKNVKSYKPKHINSIRITFNDGEQIDYNIRTRSYREVHEYYINDPCDVTDEMCREVFAINLAEMMRSKGFSQPELSARTGLSTASISKYLRKKATPTVTTLEKIAHALNCSRDDLLE